MTSVTDICNRSLQVIGTRTTVTDAELANGDTNEAIQFNLIYENNRDDLSRLAPWNCVMKTANLTYITSAPGTPENTSPATNLWTPGQPAPPWSYEYQYPVDCLRAVMLVPTGQSASGAAPVGIGVGGAFSSWTGSPPRFKVATDQFIAASGAVTVSNGGTGYSLGDILTLPVPAFSTGAPGGAPAQVLVTGVALGVITAAALINQINGEATALSGSYFRGAGTLNPQILTGGSGTGAIINIPGYVGPSDQRVILTNQQSATLAYCRQVTNPNVWDTLFQTSVINVTAANLVMALRGDRTFANDLVKLVNAAIEQARSIDGNEGFIVNDVTPDWIRCRGIAYEGLVTGPYSNFDWGGGWPSFA